MFVVSLVYKVEMALVDEHIPAHVAFLDKHYEQGHFLVSGRKVPRVGGVILAKADSKEALQVILSEDPFYQHGLADYEITEFVPSKVAAGLESFM